MASVFTDDLPVGGIFAGGDGDLGLDLGGILGTGGFGTGGSFFGNGDGDGSLGGGGFPEGGAFDGDAPDPFAAVGADAMFTADVSRGSSSRAMLPTGGSSGAGGGAAMFKADSITTSGFSSAVSTSISTIRLVVSSMGSGRTVPGGDAAMFKADATEPTGTGIATSATGPWSASVISLFRRDSGLSPL